MNPLVMKAILREPSGSRQLQIVCLNSYYEIFVFYFLKILKGCATRLEFQKSLSILKNVLVDVQFSNAG